VTYTLQGDGTFVIDGDSVVAAAGDYLRVHAAATRQVRGGRSGLRFIVVGAQPKAAYDGREPL
jgi:mannose-6-phosphate isomerase-like protein (cupin superfamily)